MKLPAEVIVVARWENEDSTSITLQDFVKDGESFIPVFSDKDEFARALNGTPYREQGVAVRTDFLRDLLNGIELLILDPHGPHPIRFRKADVEL